MLPIKDVYFYMFTEKFKYGSIFPTIPDSIAAAIWFTVFPCRFGLKEADFSFPPETMAPETMEIPELYVVGDIVVKVFFALFCFSPFAWVAAIIIDGLCCIAASEQNPLPDIELGTHPPEPLPREPPQQHRSRHSQIWGPVVPYNPGITMQSGEIQICSICLEEFKGGDACRILFRCDHTYHQTCIDDWLNRGNPDCPLCRCSVLQGRNPD